MDRPRLSHSLRTSIRAVSALLWSISFSVGTGVQAPSAWARDYKPDDLPLERVSLKIDGIDILDASEGEGGDGELDYTVHVVRSGLSCRTDSEECRDAGQNVMTYHYESGAGV